MCALPVTVRNLITYCQEKTFMARPRSNVMMHSSGAYIFFISGFSLFFQRVSSRIPCPKESRGAPRLTFPTGRTMAAKKRVTSPGDLVNLSTGKRVPTTSDWTSVATERVRHGTASCWNEISAGARSCLD